MPRILLAAAVLLQAASLAQADLLVVNNTGSGDFTTPQAAVNAAASGDVILIEHGSFGVYNTVAVDGKALIIVGEDGVTLIGRATFVNVPAGSLAVLANLDVIGNPPSFIESGQALSIEQCQGVVVVQDCDLQGGGDLPDSPTINGGTGAWILNAAEVAFVRTDVLGGNAPVGEAPSDCIFNPTLGMDGGPGVLAQASTVYAYDSTFGGGHGEPDGDQGGKGASGFFVEAGASLFASRCAFLGGDGGSGFFVGECEATGGDGGPGLKAAGHAAAVEVFMAGGAGGDGLYGHGTDGPPSAGEVFIAMGLGRSLLAPSLVQSPADLAVELQGVGGELAYLLISPALDPAVILLGVLLAPAPTLIPLGTLPPGGTLPLVLPLPALPPGLEHVVLHAQGLFVDPTGQTWPRLSGFSTLVWL